MGKTKVSEGRSKAGSDKIKIKRGITVVELTRTDSRWFDSNGKEYEAIESNGSVAYYLKKAEVVTSKVLLGICNKNPNHRLHTDTMPKSKACTCGGTYGITDLSKLEGAEVDEVETSGLGATPTPKKKKRGK